MERHSQQEYNKRLIDMMRSSLLISESCQLIIIYMMLNKVGVDLLDVQVRWAFTFYHKCQWSQAKRLSLGGI
jgi:hypothetical protein